MSGEDLVCKHVRIAGRVQGVGYRAWTEHKARALGLTGWVRNRRTGEVEAVFCGPAETVEDMLRACHDGPDWARVDSVEILSDAGEVSDSFTVEPTV